MPTYRPNDIAKELGISTKTLKNWEKDGKIPEPKKRDVWNWRIYTEEEKNNIVDLVKKNKYFSK